MRSITVSLCITVAAAGCGGDPDVDIAAPTTAAHELTVGQADIVLTSYGPAADQCGVTACYAITGKRKPEVSHFVIGTPVGCDGHLVGATLNGAAVTPTVGDHSQRGCSVHGIKFDRPLRNGEVVNVCLTYDQHFTLGQVEAAVKAGNSCAEAPVPGPTCDATEICDGVDQDCDGTVDDGVPGTGEECAEGVGACERDGTTVCDASSGDIVCDATPGEPSDELCGTEVDEDCDGETDEGYDDGDACSAGIGACYADGVKVCTEDRLATECNAVAGEPTAELCGTNVDEDCNGLTDEGYDDGDACADGIGECRREGEKVCSEDRLSTVCNAVPGEPSAELCGSGLDEDCDGLTDEGYDVGDACAEGVGECRRDGEKVCSDDRLSTVCNAVPGEPSAELCGSGLDENCDGLTDEGYDVGDACADGVGECRRDGEKVCSDDRLSTVCNAVPGDPSAELCGNGLDEDCDGTADDGFDVGDTCNVGVGACEATGSKVCAADGSGTICNAQPGAPGDELCGNGVDDDCDGTTDEGYDDLGATCAVGVGECAADGYVVCTADGLGLECDAIEGEPTAEICDGLDNDCNAAIDDGLTLDDFTSPPPVEISSAEITLVSFTYDGEAITTTACYIVQSIDDPAVSHVIEGTIGSCDDAILEITIDGVPISSDPADFNQKSAGCEPIHGVKVDNGFNSGEPRELCLVYAGFRELGTVPFQVKAGSECVTGDVPGVSCVEVEVCSP